VEESESDSNSEGASAEEEEDEGPVEEPDEGEWQEYITEKDDETPVDIARKFKCTPAQLVEHIDMKYHFQRQLLLQGVVRYQHQDTTVQVSDILTKDLGRKLHKLHRDVLFGRKNLEFISRKLPESNKTYLKRHNDELLLNAKTMQLRHAFEKSEKHTNRQEDRNTDVAHLVQALVAVLQHS